MTDNDVYREWKLLAAILSCIWQVHDTHLHSKATGALGDLEDDDGNVILSAQRQVEMVREAKETA